jgi:ABC-type phosphate transport system substrate-binding protein
MNFNKIAIAAAMAVSAFSAQAALPVGSAAETLVNAANTSGQIVFISGASAVQKGFDALVTNMLNNVVYFNNDGVTALNGSGYVAVAGNLKVAAGTWPVGSAVIVIYRNSGGSVYGVNSVARATAIQSLAVTNATCGTAGAGTAAAPYKCDSTAATTRVPDAGMSDVAPIFFTAPINTEGEVADTALTSAERASLTVKPMYAQAFGIPVTKNVESTALFNRATVAAIMSGQIVDWSSVAGTTTGGDIVICRRTPGSGSQAVVNMWAGNYPCSATAAQVPLNRDDSAAWDAATRTFTVANGAGSAIVIENDSSGNVRTCLDKAVTGGTYTAKDRSGNNVTVDFGAGGYKAIGVLSLDSIGSSLTTGNWQFRSLDGAGQITGDGLSTTVGPVTTGNGTFPTVAALNTGDWAMQGWTSFNIPTARTTGAKLAFVNQFLAQAQNPVVLAAVKETKWTASAIPNGNNAGNQTLNVSYLGGNQCAPLNRNY